MTGIIIICFIAGLMLIVTIRRFRKKLNGEVGDCCRSGASSISSCSCHTAIRESTTNKTTESIDCSFPREKG